MPIAQIILFRRMNTPYKRNRQGSYSYPFGAIFNFYLNRKVCDISNVQQAGKFHEL